MLRMHVLTVAAVAALVSAPTFAADTDQHSHRKPVYIGRPIQFFNPGTYQQPKSVDRAPYALTGDDNERPQARVQTIQVGSRQVIHDRPNH